MVAADTKEVLEEAAIVVEDVAELVERRVSWLKTTNAKLFLVGTLGIALGATASYVISAKRLRTKYQALADAQVKDVKKHYSEMYIQGNDKPALDVLASRYANEEGEEGEAGEGPASEDTVADQTRVIQRQGYVAYDQVIPSSDRDKSAQKTEVSEAKSRDDEVETTNVFELNSSFDYEEELKRREEKPDIPYVVSKDEFDQNDDELEQVTLTFYEEDDVLADAGDTPVEDKDALVGDDNMSRFGHGSEDKNIVYIRNPKLNILIEVVHSDGSFAREVLGFQHSDRPTRRRFRASDE